MWCERRVYLTRLGVGLRNLLAQINFSSKRRRVGAEHIAAIDDNEVKALMYWNGFYQICASLLLKSHLDKVCSSVTSYSGLT